MNNYEKENVYEDDSDADADFESYQQKENPKTPVKVIISRFQMQSVTPQSVQPKSASSNRFSFSKLSKFVSKSALKVMNRKTSSGSMGDSPSSSNSSSPSTSMTEDCVDTGKKMVAENFYNTLEPTLVAPVVAQPAQTKPIPTRVQTLRTNSLSSTAGRPVMGLTALMINRLRKQQQQAGSQYSQYGMTTGLCTAMPNMYLVGLPVVFNSSSLAYEQDDTRSIQSNCYDRLVNVRPGAQQTHTQQTPKKSILVNKTNTTTPVSSCRMTVFNAQPMKINGSQHPVEQYDTIDHALF